MLLRLTANENLMTYIKGKRRGRPDVPRNSSIPSFYSFVSVRYEYLKERKKLFTCLFIGQTYIFDLYFKLILFYVLLYRMFLNARTIHKNK